MTHTEVPIEFCERWERFYGDEKTNTIIMSLKRKDPRIIFPNTLKIQLRELKQYLIEEGFEFKEIKQFNALRLIHEPFNIVSTPMYLTGYFSIHAITSIFPSKALQVKPDTSVADLAAAPGIKTQLLAQEMNNSGTIIAIEKSKFRLSALKANLARMGIINTIVLNMDAINFPKLRLKVDYILLDAPCSGTGLKLTKNKRLSPKSLKDVLKHANQQKGLLKSAWRQLKPKGTLVYSTCSLEPEEGEALIQQFLEEHPEEIQIIPITFPVGQPGTETQWNSTFNSQLKNTKRIFPALGYDGFFIAALKKKCV
jgi:NOL1/NOP2/sun family putative RNA methylase